jgi:serine phosphatase RsbU (regulator of sigma subunit)
VLAATWTSGSQPGLASTQPGDRWQDLPAELRTAIAALRGRPLLAATSGPDAAGITFGHPEGTLALWLELDPAWPFTAEDQAVLTILCGYLGEALRRLHQIGQQRQTALALQHAILGPAQLPPGFAARYEPAAHPLEVGGDWYDTVALPGGRTGIVVGDCVGHDLHAATVMGQLRSACRALLLQDASPARTLQALDRFAVSVPGALLTTVVCAVLDPATGNLTYSSAGHPPAILARPDGT